MLLRLPLLLMALALSSGMAPPVVDELSMTPRNYKTETADLKAGMDEDAEGADAMAALSLNMTSEDIAEMKAALQNRDEETGDEEIDGDTRKASAALKAITGQKPDDEHSVDAAAKTGCTECTSRSYVETCMRANGFTYCNRWWCKQLQRCRDKCKRRCQAWKCSGSTRQAQANGGNICRASNCDKADSCNA